LVLSIVVNPPASHADPALHAVKTDALVVDNDGDGRADPGDTIGYAITITNLGSTDAAGVTFSDRLDANLTLVPGSIKTTPLSLDDAYAAIGNVGIEVPAPGVLGNDVDPDGGPLSVVAVAGGNSANGGDFDIVEDGSFTYIPPAGFEGTDGFSYTAEDADGNSETASVTIEVSGMIWFVDADATCPCDGRINTPFVDLAVTPDSFDANAPDDPGDHIFAAEGAYVGGLALLDGQTLIGEGATGGLASILGIAPPPFTPALPSLGGTNPIIESSQDGIITGQNNTVRGLTIGDTGGTGIRGTAVGTLTVSETTIHGSGGGLNIVGGNLDVALDSLSAASDTEEGVLLSGATGTFNVTGSNGVVDVANVPAVDLTGAGGGLLVNATFATVASKNSASHGLKMTNLAPGSVFDGGAMAVASSATDGITLSNNAGSTFTFDDLVIDNAATNQRGLFATVSGSLNIGNGDIDAGTGRAVDLDRTELSVTLSSVTSIGGSSPGIELDTTTGSFTVDGDGSNTTLGGNASGGTISDKTGGDGTNNGIGVLLTDAANVTLRRMQLADFQNFAVRGNDVHGFELSFTTIDGGSGTSLAADEDCVRFEDLTGTVSIADCDLSGGFEDNIRVVNTSGTLNLSLTGSLIGTNGNDGALLETRGSANATLTITENSFTAAPGDLLQTNALDTSVMDLVIADNDFSNDHPGILSGGGGVTISGGGGGSNVTLTYAVEHNTFRDAKGIALNVAKGSGGGSFEGEITGNDVGVSGVALSGSSQASGIRVRSAGAGTHTTLIDDNSVFQTNETGITLIANDGDGTLNATVTNNSIGEPGEFTFAGLFVDCGALNSDSTLICADIGGTGNENSFVGAGGVFGLDFVSATSTNATINMPGLAGGAGSVAAYIQGRNNGTPSVDAFGNYTGSGTSCPTPSFAKGLDDVEAERVSLREAKQPTRDPVAAVPAPVVAPEAVAVAAASVNQTVDPGIEGAVTSGGILLVDIGMLPVGKEITITFEATVNDPPVPDAVDEVCNQGVISGSNFAEVLTDDPDTAALNDPTCTDIPARGACCILATCLVLSEDECVDAGGLYEGDYTVCDPSPCICGDLDGDQDVDDRDFQKFLAAFGRSLGDGSGLFNPEADFDLDETVTFLDFEVWLDCYRTFVGDPAAVPELYLRGDYDADYDVDVVDYGYFWDCQFDPQAELEFPCAMHFDFDGNGKIDLRDFSVFQRSLTGLVP
jgi:uncharacterized repeat protein (TIGR01451 family)